MIRPLRMLRVAITLTAIHSCWNTLARAVENHQDSCAQLDSSHMKCVKWNILRVSGGGKWFGPFYTLGSGSAPEGYQVESASFHLIGPHPCDGDDSSPVNHDPPLPSVPANSLLTKIGLKLIENPPRYYIGHPTGIGKWAVCYRDSKDEGSVVWKYSIQGVEGESVFYVWPGTDKGLVEIDSKDARSIKESARLDVIYVKTPSKTR